MKTLLAVLSLVSASAFAQDSGQDRTTEELLKAEFSHVLLATAGEMAALREDCGYEFENLKKINVSTGVREYAFEMKQRGLGRLGGTIFKHCQVQILVDWSRTWTDGGVTYKVTHQVLPTASE